MSYYLQLRGKSRCGHDNAGFECGVYFNSVFMRYHRKKYILKKERKKVERSTDAILFFLQSAGERKTEFNEIGSKTVRKKPICVAKGKR